MQGQLVGGGHVDRGELDAGFHQVGDASASQEHELWILFHCELVRLHEPNQLLDIGIGGEMASQVVFGRDEEYFGQLLQRN